MLAVLTIAQPQFAIAETHNVLVKDNFFSPRDLIINPGDTVIWTSESDGACDPYGGGCPPVIEHTVTADDFSFSSGAPSEDIFFSRVFSDAGENLYFCEVHSEPGKDINAFMNGRITVQGEETIFQINAGLNDAWVHDGAPFQGFFFTVFPVQGFFFLSWFTFDSVPPGESVTAVFGAAGQRWVTGGSGYSGDTVTISLELTFGGNFNSNDPTADQQADYGTITIVFINCNEALLTYNFPSLGLMGQMTLTRAVADTDNVALCNALNAELQMMQ